MSRASEDLLDLLHSLVAGSLNDELARAAERAALPRTIKDDDGKDIPNPDYQALNPQLIDKALKFLKDNGIDAPKKSQRVDSLASTLAELDIDEVGHDIHTAH
jgi:hypothetical protein